MIKIFIDPRARISYASYYIYGLSEIYGKKQVKFSMKYFNDLIQENGLDDFDHYFAFVVIENKKIIKRIVIDYRDKNSINNIALNWCDTYGKVNFNSSRDEFEKLPEFLRSKILPIGPNFGIKIWNNFETGYRLITNYLKSFNKLPVSFRSFIAGYNWQIKRMSYSDYRKSDSRGDYVFFVSSLYLKKANNNVNTNQYRAAFIRACKKISSISFEGGLFASGKHPNKASFEDVLTSLYIQPNEYLNKIRKSAIVFNTPAIWGCHGWKLGEFLAMGKAIISTPLLNEMPFLFEQGKQIHFVNSEKDIEIAVQKIINDRSYRQQLESGALEYFEKHLTPEEVIKRLIGY